MGLPAGTAGLKRHIGIPMEFASRTISPGDGWVRGTVARRSRAHGFSHVVRYCPGSALGAAMVDSLLDAASHGPAGRWILLCPTR